MMIVLRLAVVLLWIPAQRLGMLAGGWGLLGFQMGEPLSGVLGVLVFLLPAVVAVAALWYSFVGPYPRAMHILVGAVAILALIILPAWLAGR